MRRPVRSLERRLEALERQLAGLPERPTPEEQARRDARSLELCSAALEDRDPDLELTAEEAALFEEVCRYVPVYREMIDEGIITPDGRPGAPAAGRGGGRRL